uniref:Uncharacterized protein n=1 Tax=Knipowitschia caucasica TaxID=637954 RepID=A0AAV2LDT1_KNICA
MLGPEGPGGGRGGGGGWAGSRKNPEEMRSWQVYMFEGRAHLRLAVASCCRHRGQRRYRFLAVIRTLPGDANPALSLSSPSPLPLLSLSSPSPHPLLSLSSPSLLPLLSFSSPSSPKERPVTSVHRGGPSDQPHRSGPCQYSTPGPQTPTSPVTTVTQAPSETWLPDPAAGIFRTGWRWPHPDCPGCHTSKPLAHIKGRQRRVQTVD